MPIQTYRDLEVWQRSVDVVTAIYQLSRSFPADERFGLTNQLRRAAISVPSNIAEGYGRGYQADYLRFLSIARGSLMEVETQLHIALRLKFVDDDQFAPVWDMVQETGRLLHGLIRSLRRSVKEATASYSIDNELDTIPMPDA